MNSFKFDLEWIISKHGFPLHVQEKITLCKNYNRREVSIIGDGFIFEKLALLVVGYMPDLVIPIAKAYENLAVPIDDV